MHNARYKGQERSCLFCAIKAQNKQRSEGPSRKAANLIRLLCNSLKQEVTVQ